MIQHMVILKHSLSSTITRLDLLLLEDCVVQLLVFKFLEHFQHTFNDLSIQGYRCRLTGSP